MPAAIELADPLNDWLAGLTPPPGVPRRVWMQALAGPLREFLTRPGQRFRARLVTSAWHLSGRSDPPPPQLPLMIELLHAGSLIVDDIEDGSLQRRGRATLHRLVGLPSALNVGNWLYFAPLTLLEKMGLPAERELRLHRAVVAALRRCHEGQALDLTSRVGELHPDEIPGVALTISERKTGGLTGLAVEFGAVAAGAPEPLVDALVTFAIRLGVGLQMQNDLAELTGAAGPFKHPEDLIHGRVTWPWAWAAEVMPAGPFDALQMRGKKLAEGHGDAAALARDLLAALQPDPTRRVQLWLTRALADLGTVVPTGPGLTMIHAEVDRLLQNYG